MDPTLNLGSSTVPVHASDLASLLAKARARAEIARMVDGWPSAPGPQTLQVVTVVRNAAQNPKNEDPFVGWDIFVCSRLPPAFPLSSPCFALSLDGTSPKAVAAGMLPSRRPRPLPRHTPPGMPG